MSNPIKKRVVRLAVDVTAFVGAGFTDFITQASPQFWNASGVEVQVAFFQGNPYNGAGLADVSALTQVYLLIADSQKGANVYVNQAMAGSPGLDTALTLAEWQAGFSVRSGFTRACHCVFIFESSGFVLLNSTQSNADFWSVLYGNDSTDPTSTDLFGGGNITVLNAGLPASGQNQAANIVPVATSYDGSGHYTLTTVAGTAYIWTKGSNDMSVTNGSNTITDGSVWVASGTTVTLNGTPSVLVTASVWYPVALTVAAFTALFQAAIGSSGGNKIYYGAVNPNGSQLGNVGDFYSQIDGSGNLIQQFTKLTGTNTNTGWG